MSERVTNYPNRIMDESLDPASVDANVVAEMRSDIRDATDRMIAISQEIESLQQEDVELRRVIGNAQAKLLGMPDLNNLQLRETADENE